MLAYTCIILFVKAITFTFILCVTFAFDITPNFLIHVAPHFPTAQFHRALIDYVSLLGNKGTNPTALPMAVGLSVAGVVMVTPVGVILTIWIRYVDPSILDNRSPKLHNTYPEFLPTNQLRCPLR